MTPEALNLLLEEREAKVRKELIAAQQQKQQQQQQSSSTPANDNVKAVTKQPEEPAKKDPEEKSEPKKKDPTFVVGFPKSGTTTMYEYFTCGGARAQHYCAHTTNDHPPCPNGTMGSCIIDNMINGIRPFLTGCGDDFEVYCQIDVERPVRFFNKTRQVLFEDGSHDPHDKTRTFLPQQFNLQEIHDDYPTSTFILPLRTKEAWANSVTNWFQLRIRFFNEYVLTKGLKDKFGDKPKDKEEQLEFLMRIYEDHTQTVRDFVKQHPSHKLVEVVITDPNAGQTMQDAFGYSKDCFGHSNAFGNRTTNKFAKNN